MPEKSYRNRNVIPWVLATTLLLAACEGSLGGMSDRELQEKAHECMTEQEQSPGMAIQCDNYRRECQRRRDAGRFVC